MDNPGAFVTQFLATSPGTTLPQATLPDVMSIQAGGDVAQELEAQEDEACCAELREALRARLMQSTTESMCCERSVVLPSGPPPEEYHHPAVAPPPLAGPHDTFFKQMWPNMKKKGWVPPVPNQLYKQQVEHHVPPSHACGERLKMRYPVLPLVHQLAMGALTADPRHDGRVAAPQWRGNPLRAGLVVLAQSQQLKTRRVYRDPNSAARKTSKPLLVREDLFRIGTTVARLHAAAIACASKPFAMACVTEELSTILLCGGLVTRPATSPNALGLALAHQLNWKDPDGLPDTRFVGTTHAPVLVGSPFRPDAKTLGARTSAGAPPKDGTLLWCAQHQSYGIVKQGSVLTVCHGILKCGTLCTSPCLTDSEGLAQRKKKEKRLLEEEAMAMGGTLLWCVHHKRHVIGREGALLRVGTIGCGTCSAQCLTDAEDLTQRKQKGRKSLKAGDVAMGDEAPARTPSTAGEASTVPADDDAPSSGKRGKKRGPTPKSGEERTLPSVACESCGLSPHLKSDNLDDLTQPLCQACLSRYDQPDADVFLGVEVAIALMGRLLVILGGESALEALQKTRLLATQTAQWMMAGAYPCAVQLDDFVNQPLPGVPWCRGWAARSIGDEEDTGVLKRHQRDLTAFAQGLCSAYGNQLPRMSAAASSSKTVEQLSVCDTTGLWAEAGREAQQDALGCAAAHERHRLHIFRHKVGETAEATFNRDAAGLALEHGRGSARGVLRMSWLLQAVDCSGSGEAVVERAQTALTQAIQESLDPALCAVEAFDGDGSKDERREVVRLLAPHAANALDALASRSSDCSGSTDVFTRMRGLLKTDPDSFFFAPGNDPVMHAKSIELAIYSNHFGYGWGPELLWAHRRGLPLPGTPGAICD